MIKQTIFFIAALIFCNAAFSQNDETANVLGLERTTADAFTKHNLVNVNSAFADDASIINAKGELITKQQLMQYVSNINSVVVSDMKVKIKGAIAIVTGMETETGKDNSGTAYSNKSRFTDVLEKVKGQWQITASQATSMDQQ
jgi:ketosteroid isomerase-like protein